VQIALFPPGLAASERKPEIDVEYEALFAKLPEILAGLVRLSAASAPPSERAALHQRWLNALTAIGLESWDQSQTAPLQAALDSLTAKDSKLLQQSQRYAAATSDYLRWRERTASLQARRRYATFPPLANVVTPVLRSHEGAQYLLGPQAPMTQCAVLMRLDAVARESSIKLLGKTVAAATCIRPSWSGLGHGALRGEVFCAVRDSAFTAIGPSGTAAARTIT
jgi:hypothetical protein